ncbi:MAG: IPExxxVDY family protein [Flavobacteriaceae bacterium]
MSSANTYRISEDLCVEEYVLIALHSSLEDHAIVYLLNHRLKLLLSRSVEDLEIEGQGCFPVFDWKDKINDRYWTLFTNNSVKVEELNRVDLFQNELSQTVHHLVPEHREVDYFLKIEQGDESLEDKVIREILTIPNIITAYMVDTERLKSKHNLIY